MAIPKILSIAGSDCSAGAGIQADLKTASALNCYGTTVLTAVTAQNTMGVKSVMPLPVKIIIEQIECVLSDIGADAIKIGLLPTNEIIISIANKLKQYPNIPIVLDPVLIATSGDTLTKNDIIKVLIKHLIPLSTIVTPNIDEATALTGIDATNTSNHTKIWSSFERMGAKALLLKGGHNPQNGKVIDTLFTVQGVHHYTSNHIITRNTHGTGCSLSSAIASFLAHGKTLSEATEHATAYVHHAIASATELNIGKGNGPICHFYKFW